MDYLNCVICDIKIPIEKIDYKQVIDENDYCLKCAYRYAIKNNLVDKKNEIRTKMENRKNGV